jgi:general secretion pathway protein B
MSYILDALRKSEQERQAKENPSLDNQILENTQPHKTGKWLWIIIFIAIAVASLFWLTREPSDKFIAQPETQHETNKNPKKTLLAKPEKKPSAKSQSQPLPAEDKPEPATTASKPQLSIAERVKARKALLVKAAAEKQIQEIATAPVNDPAKPVSEPVQPTIKSKIKPLPDIQLVEKVAKPENSVPLLKELPFEFRRNVPNLNINVFVYAEDPAERFILVDMKKYTSGQQITGGMTLKEILSDSLVVSYKNKTFRIKRQ